MSICISKQGDGEPCPGCGATSTVVVEAVPAHARCLHCGNSWGSGETANDHDAGEILRIEHEWFRIVLVTVFAVSFLLGFLARGQF